MRRRNRLAAAGTDDHRRASGIRALRQIWRNSGNIRRVGAVGTGCAVGPERNGILHFGAGVTRDDQGDEC